MLYCGMCIIVWGTSFTNSPSIHVHICPSWTVGHKCHGMGHVGYSRDCPLCPEGTMGQDRQHNMTHGMGHMGYSRDCPLCPEGTMG